MAIRGREVVFLVTNRIAKIAKLSSQRACCSRRETPTFVRRSQRTSRPQS